MASLLAAMTAAVRRHSSTDFADLIDDSPAAQDYRQRALTDFAALQQLPVRTWRWRLEAPLDSAVAAPAARAATRRFGAPAVVVAVELDEQLTGVDRIPDRHDVYLTVIRRGGHDLVASDDAPTGLSRPSWRPPWSGGPIAVRTTPAAVVIGPAAAADRLAAVAAAASAAVPAVTAVWGSRWGDRVAVVVAGDATRFGALTGLADADHYSAAAVTDGIDPVSGLPYGQRLIVSATGFARLDALGRTVVLRHEITHLATAAATSEVSPRWLVEGFAEYVAHRGLGEPVTRAAAELRAAVAAGRLPAALPGPADFASGDPAALARAYEESWLACRVIADEVGTAGLVRFYRAVGASLHPMDQAVADAMHAVLHTTVAVFTARWRADLRKELG